MVFLLPRCFRSALEHASSETGHINVFQRVGVSRQLAGPKHTPEVMRGLARKSVGTKRKAMSLRASDAVDGPFPGACAPRIWVLLRPTIQRAKRCKRLGRSVLISPSLFSDSLRRRRLPRHA